MIDEDSIKPVMATLQRAYPRQRWDDGTAKVWAAALGDLQLRDIAGAVAGLIQESKWPPSIAEVREIAMERSQLRCDRLAVGRITQAMQLPASASSPDPKARMHFDNIRRWANGEVSTADMVLESARIYADEGARPGDGPAVMAEAREIAASLGDGDGPLAKRLKSNVVRLQRRGSA